MRAFLKASTDCFSMTLLGKEFQSLILRAIKLCWYLFVLAPTWMNFLRWNCLVPCRLLNNIYGGNCVADRPETTLNIGVNRATFLLFSSVSHFKSFRIFVTVLGVVLYSFVTKRAIRLCTLSMLNVQIACTTSILKPWHQFKFLEARQTNVKTIWSIVTSAGIVI